MITQNPLLGRVLTFHVFTDVVSHSLCGDTISVPPWRVSPACQAAERCDVLLTGDVWMHVDPDVPPSC